MCGGLSGVSDVTGRARGGGRGNVSGLRDWNSSLESSCRAGVAARLKMICAMPSPGRRWILRWPVLTRVTKASVVDDGSMTPVWAVICVVAGVGGREVM